MNPARYSAAAMALHWLIAVALAFQISLGWTLEGPPGPPLFARYQLHKSVGIAILVLSVVRLAIRFTTARPAPSDGPAWARFLARSVHNTLYVILIGAPLTGWALVSTAKIKVPTLLFGAIPLPHLPLPGSLSGSAEAAHSALAWIAVGLVVLHIAGALRHQWLLGKPELQRMIPFANGKGVMAALAAFALIGGGMALGKMVSPDTVAPKLVADAPVAMRQAPPTDTPASTKSAPEAGVPDDAATAQVETMPQPIADWAVTSGGRVGFTARWNGDVAKGSFKTWGATIRFSPDLLDDSRISATIDLASADTGDGQRDDTLKGSDFFDTALHPRATFTSRRITHLGNDRYVAAGTLDLHGTVRPVTLRFTLKIDDNAARVSGTARIDRTAFGVGSGDWASTGAIAGEVDIDLAFNATRR